MKQHHLLKLKQSSIFNRMLLFCHSVCSYWRSAGPRGPHRAQTPRSSSGAPWRRSRSTTPSPRPSAPPSRAYHSGNLPAYFSKSSNKRHTMTSHTWVQMKDMCALFMIHKHRIIIHTDILLPQLHKYHIQWTRYYFSKMRLCEIITLLWWQNLPNNVLKWEQKKTQFFQINPKRTSTYMP